MRIVIFGLSITSSWGNGHATTFRALCRALRRRGHQIVFYEKNTEWYASNRDLPNPDFCETRIFEDWDAVLPNARQELKNADMALVGSYFPCGKQATDEMLESSAAVKGFYDIDTPVTVAELLRTGATDYLRRDQIPGFDLYFSFTGGPMLREIGKQFGARRPVPLYCSFDPEQYHRFPPHKRYQCDLSYMGTYSPDRQPKLEEFLCEAARRLPERSFLVAGPQYPKSVRWPANVRRIVHLNPRWHARLYSSSRITLNVTRRDMVLAGWSPSVRLFEAAASGAAIISDEWPGLNTFFSAGSEILLPVDASDIVRYLTEIDEAELLAIGNRAQARVLGAHTSEHRAREFEKAVEAALSPAAGLKA